MARLLRAAGHDCARVYDLGLGGHSDEQTMALADRETGSSYQPIPTSESFSPTGGTRPPAAGVAGYPGCVADAEQAVQRAQAVAHNRSLSPGGPGSPGVRERRAR